MYNLSHNQIFYNIFLIYRTHCTKYIMYFYYFIPNNEITEGIDIIPSVLFYQLSANFLAFSTNNLNLSSFLTGLNHSQPCAAVMP